MKGEFCPEQINVFCQEAACSECEIPNKPKRIFVSHPYGRRRGLSGKELQDNVDNSIRYGIEIIKKGHNPFIPLLYHYVSQFDSTITEETFLNMSVEWVKQCDALFVSSISPGVQVEIDTARKHLIPIYRSLSEIRSIL